MEAGEDDTTGLNNKCFIEQTVEKVVDGFLGIYRERGHEGDGVQVCRCVGV